MATALYQQKDPEAITIEKYTSTQPLQLMMTN